MLENPITLENFKFDTDGAVIEETGCWQHNMFGKLSDLKIRELIFSEDSPINLIYRIPEVLYTYIYYSINIPKNVTKQWFEDKFLQNN